MHARCSALLIDPAIQLCIDEVRAVVSHKFKAGQMHYLAVCHCPNGSRVSSHPRRLCVLSHGSDTASKTTLGNLTTPWSSFFTFCCVLSLIPNFPADRRVHASPSIGRIIPTIPTVQTSFGRRLRRQRSAQTTIPSTRTRLTPTATQRSSENRLSLSKVRAQRNPIPDQLRQSAHFCFFDQSCPKL